MNSDGIIKSLNQLTPNQVALWGKMTPQHMVEHLYKTVQASIDELKLNIYTEERKVPTLKRIFLGNKELPKEFMNPAIGADLLELEFSDLQTAIVELEKIFLRYESYFREHPTAKTAHPVFGYLTKDEWDVFHHKHFKHHLSQFGLKYST
jgi:hypothetical protein